MVLARVRVLVCVRVLACVMVLALLMCWLCYGVCRCYYGVNPQWMVAWVTRPERPKSTKDRVKRARRAAS